MQRQQCRVVSRASDQTPLHCCSILLYFNWHLGRADQVQEGLGPREVPAEEVRPEACAAKARGTDAERG